MKLLPLSKDRESWLKEFDHWVTPYLEEIRDSEVFHKTIKNIKTAIELLGAVNARFTTNDAASAKYITKALMNGLKGEDADKSYSLVIAFCDLMFLITGKTDNNYKCQFPVYIKEILKWNDYPAVKRNQLMATGIPRVIKAENIALLTVQFESAKSKISDGTLEQLRQFDQIESAEQQLLFRYFEFILDQDIYLRSLKIFGSKYFELQQNNVEDDLLAPIIIGYVRGSASASGGHKPEFILRTHMNSWGLKANEDYNTADVKPFLEEPNKKKKKKKTRSYDFVLPFNVRDWQNRVFIQAQFYAGDSGSVSHKNVDQTSASRDAVKKKISNPKFVEYVDGAGYFGSLNGDLKRLLDMRTTDNFFQIRTFPIKLRQILQDIGFLTPLELVHAVVTKNFDINLAAESLENDGYRLAEINRVVEKIYKEGLAKAADKIEGISFESNFYELSRKYFLLDCLAIYGKKLAQNSKGCIFVPGYSEYFGAKTSEVLEKVREFAGNYYKDWQSPQIFSQDLEFLIEKKWVVYNI